MNVYSKAVVKKVTTDDLVKVLQLWGKLGEASRAEMRVKYPNMDEGLKVIRAELKRRKHHSGMDIFANLLDPRRLKQ